MKRFAVDTGGTFTDLMIQDDDGTLELVKAPTTPDDPIRGVLDALQRAAEMRSVELPELLDGGELVFATTRAINAILTSNVARTGFLTTQGHEDVLVLRAGGRPRPFDFTQSYPEPYIPRRLTRGIAERTGADGEIVTPLDEEQARAAIGELAELGAEAIAVCLIWSIAEPAHELRLGSLIEEVLPGTPYTLSHQLNPVLGEYERASSTAIDASLKPLMSEHLGRLEEALRAAGLTGGVLVATSSGALMPAAEVAAAPIHSLNSGPAMAPLAGRSHAGPDETAIVADAGGTTFDVSVIRDGVISRTRESWIGEAFLGHLTGFPSIELRSIGAGGGSIAHVDEAGLLHVGPQSAGSDPGPACYGNGGKDATLTDAVAVLGYLDPQRFLDGAMDLDLDAARAVVERTVAQPLGLTTQEAAAAILELATEQMIQAIDGVAIERGLDLERTTMVAGGGAAGLNAVAIASRLGCKRVLLPESGAALSASGALRATVGRDAMAAVQMRSDAFEPELANSLLSRLEAEAREFLRSHGVADAEVQYWVEARYPNQFWDLEIRLPQGRFESAGDVERLVEAFHRRHKEVFAVEDPGSPIEINAWRVRATETATHELGSVSSEHTDVADSSREVYIGGTERAIPVVALLGMKNGVTIEGPAIVEAPSTTIVLEPGTSATRVPGRYLEVTLGAAHDSAPAAETTGEVSGR